MKELLFEIIEQINEQFENPGNEWDTLESIKSQCESFMAYIENLS